MRRTKTTKFQHKPKIKAVPKNQDRGEYVTAQEADAMFRRWCQIKDVGKGGGYKGVGTEFGRDTKTIRRIAEKSDWKGRYAKIVAEIQKHTDKKIAKETISNLTLARALRTKICRELLRSNKDLDASVKDAVLIMRYEDELVGNLPGAGTEEQDHGPVPPEQLDKALHLLGKMDEKTIEGLGKALIEVTNESIAKDDDDQED